MERDNVALIWYVFNTIALIAILIEKWHVYEQFVLHIRIWSGKKYFSKVYTIVSKVNIINNIKSSH